jgi:tetratricopeptide (TPR) repeat protein
LNRIRTFLVIFVVATFLASFFAGSALWGLSAYRFMSINWGLLLALFVLILQNGSIADRVASAISSVGRIKGAAYLSAAVFIILAFLLRSTHDLWGERLIVAQSVESGLLFHPNAPLGMLVNHLFFRAANSLLLLTAPASTSLLGIIAGGCFVLGAFTLARIISAGGDRPISALLLLSNGYIILFFGAGGNAPISMLFSLLFIVSALLHLRGRAPLLAPSALFLVAALSHISAIYLLPSLVYLFVRGFGRGGRKGEALNACFVTVGAWIVVEVAARVIWGVPGPAQNLLSRALASLSITGGSLLAESFTGAFNALLLTGPAVFAALALIAARPESQVRPDTAAQPDATTSPDAATRPDPPSPEGTEAMRAERGFLTAAAVPALLLCIAAGWRVEHGLRWYVIASTGPAFAAYTLLRLRRLFGEGARFRRVATMLAVLGIFHTLPLLLTNAIPDAAERRLLSLPLPEGQGETILGVRAFERSELETAERWLTEAAARDSLNDLARYYLGRVYMKQEYYMRAITNLYEAHTLRPGSIQYRFDLAGALIEYDWYEEAIEQLEFLTQAYPDSIRFWKRLGYARNHGGKYAEAITAYERALLMEPSKEDNVLALVSAVTNRGTELQKEGNIDEARKYYELAIKLYPIGWAAQNNLAALELDLGNIEEAYAILEKALKRHPTAAKLNLNMGLVLEKMGRFEEAYSYIRKSLELDPLSAGAEDHLNRMLKEAREREQAR